MVKSFEDMQNLNKEGFEAFAASSAAMTKGYQAVATEVADFSKKSFEKSTAAFQTAAAAGTFEKAIEANQTFAKESFDAAMAEMTKIGEIFSAAAKSAFQPYEASFAAFGLKK